MLDQLKGASLTSAAAFFLLANVTIFGSSVAGCWLLGFCFPSRRIFERWEPLRTVEIYSALGSILLNTFVSLVGYWLWKRDVLQLNSDCLAMSLAGCLGMLVFMDFGMYVLHRAVHFPQIFPLVHRFHHRHEVTNPISLFVLHPLEVLGFGMLMIGFLSVFTISLGGLLGYLTLNVLWGTLGHCGVEPFPKWFTNVPLLNLVGTSTFHAEHHEHPKFNFGFYTLIWDKLFGTLDPDYEARFKGE